MTRRLLVTYLALAAVMLLVLEVPLAVIQQRSVQHDLQQRVERDAVALAALVEDALHGETVQAPQTVEVIVERYSRDTGVRVVVVNARGAALADTDDDRPLGRDFTSRVEIAAALRGEVATGQRHSKTLNQNLLYVAVPVASGGQIYGAVRASVPTSRIDRNVTQYRALLVLIAAGVLLATVVAGRWLARWVATPLLGLRDTAREVAKGDLGRRATQGSGPPEVREVATAFNHMVARLEALVDAQEQFVADASHQLRSPLTALRLRIETLDPNDPDHEGAVDAALDEVDRLTRMVNGLLSLARADRRDRERHDRDLGGVVRERVHAWAPLAEEQGVSLSATAAERVIVNVGDDSVEQIIDNLLANALGVMSAGGHISVTVDHDGGMSRVVVADTGPGMTPDTRAHAFDRFWTGRPDRSGSGLGLAIVKRLAEADTGTVDLDDNPGGGLRVTVRYPRV